MPEIHRVIYLGLLSGTWTDVVRNPWRGGHIIAEFYEADLAGKGLDGGAQNTWRGRNLTSSPCAHLGIT